MAEFEEYEVLYDWEAETTEDLALFTGEFVQVLEKNEHGWWLGVIERDGTLSRGYFPKNYIKEKPRIRDAPLPPPRPVSLVTSPTSPGHPSTIDTVSASLQGASLSPSPKAGGSTGGVTASMQRRAQTFSLRSLSAFDDLMNKNYAVEILNESSGKGLIGAVGQKVVMHVVGSIWDGANTDTIKFTEGTVKFVIGKHEVVPGLEAAAQIIAEQQSATVTCSPLMAYGAAGYPPVVPPNTFIVFQVKIESVQDAPADHAVEGPTELLISGVASSRSKPVVTKKPSGRVVLVEGTPSS